MIVYEVIPLKFIAVGKILRSHGLKGTLVFALYEKDAISLTELPSVIIKNKQGDIGEYKVLSVKPWKNWHLIEIDKINSINDAESLLQAELFVKDTDLSYGENPLSSALNGIKVFSEKGVYLGYVCNIIHTMGHDIYEIRNETRCFHVPAVKDFIVEVDYRTNKLIVSIPDDLINVNEI